MTNAAISPNMYHGTVDKLTETLAAFGWRVVKYGSEYLPLEVRHALQLCYNMTNLYVRTRPDLLVSRDNLYETFLVECKDWTCMGDHTGHLAVEAIPWFIARHLRKMKIRYLFAVENREFGFRLFRPDAPPFCEICTIFLPNLHKDVFKKEVLVGLKTVFPKIPFKLVEIRQTNPGASQDPFILIPSKMLAESGRPLEYFAKWGWR